MLIYIYVYNIMIHTYPYISILSILVVSSQIIPDPFRVPPVPPVRETHGGGDGTDEGREDAHG